MTQNFNFIDIFFLDFLNNSIFTFLLNNFIFEGLIIISIICLASRAPKVLDTATKVVTISTGSTVLYNNWIKGDSSDSNNDKDENKKDETKQDESKQDKPIDLSESNEK
jgi:hypothetical protein